MVGCWQGGSTFKSSELTKVIGRLQGCNWVNKCGRMLTRWIEIQLTRAPARHCWSRSEWKRRKWARSQNQTENWSSKENVVKSFWPTIMIAQHAPTSFGESGSWIQFDHIISWEGAHRGQNPQNQSCGPSKSSLYWQKSKPSIILENLKCLNVVVCTSEGNVGRRL